MTIDVDRLERLWIAYKSAFFDVKTAPGGEPRQKLVPALTEARDSLDTASRENIEALLAHSRIVQEIAGADGGTDDSYEGRMLRDIIERCRDLVK